MNPARWRRIEEIFQAVADLPPTKARAQLDLLCADDLDLRRDVESLLQYDNPDGDKLATVVANAVDTLDDLDGDRIGNYRLIKPIGYGGMGVVYQAERTGDGFQQVVAIKLLKRGLEYGHAMERFRQERHILARLDHPNIARLLDGGTTAEGIPYLVMEFVDGKPLLEYCAEHRLGVPERLRLFRAICSAVRYAHNNLVIHRDIKPANVLVDPQGVPKLLDFGIAKLLDSTAPAALTVRMLTPDYASPEQVLGQPVTTATDVYSLGALLYELLAGVRPFQLAALGPSAITRAVTQTDPPPPSGATSNNKLRKHLQGDLDNIILMALRKEPERRYSSVDQFSVDVQRHLDGLPVQARKDIILYRTRKFVSRERWLLAAATLVISALITSIFVAQGQARRAEYRFEQVRRLANTSLFDFDDRVRALPGSEEARRLVVRNTLDYLQSVDTGAGVDPSLEWELASVYEKLAKIQSELGDTGGTRHSYRRALELVRSYSASHAGNTGARKKLESLRRLASDAPQ